MCFAKKEKKIDNIEKFKALYKKFLLQKGL